MKVILHYIVSHLHSDWSLNIPANNLYCLVLLRKNLSDASKYRQVFYLIGGQSWLIRIPVLKNCGKSALYVAVILQLITEFRFVLDPVVPRGTFVS